LAFAYLHMELQYEEEALFRQLMRGGLIPPRVDIQGLQRDRSLDSAAIFACAPNAAKSVTVNLTKTLRAVTISNAHTHKIIELFNEAGNDYRSDKFYAAVAIALRSEDEELAPFIIEAFNMR